VLVYADQGRSSTVEAGPNASAVPQGQSKYDVDKENEGGGRGGMDALSWNNERQKCLSCSKMDLSAEGLLPVRSLH